MLQVSPSLESLISRYKLSRLWIHWLLGIVEKSLYTPLSPLPEEMRLLRVLPDDGSSPIQCDLGTCQSKVDDLPVYTALLYVCGVLEPNTARTRWLNLTQHIAPEREYLDPQDPARTTLSLKLQPRGRAMQS